ncbi:AAA family ATPase [Ornithinibacillus californiensis]|uniref:AAA family ATPase n=1 Tax=Ornithinibacillus californiensis TaxID=161536 RepID=UPI00069F036A|nr:AAA family ATPase [Ornithinibacillus californiensis]
MRAIKLSMTAFGPYLEKQTINFDMLGDESIFLITGPTGAGKTTIFDAICYALYGKASGSDRDQDSLRSHFAAVEEPTEVEFQFALNNHVYEIIRNPKQLKKKDRGEGFTEEPAKAVLYEIMDGEKQLISSRIKDVNETIEERLGFDYEQFRKMVLIPQGEFRKLISENSREREAILQKIFRTHFYEKMTEELKAQSKDLEAGIKKLEADMEYEFSRISWKQVEIDENDSEEVRLEKLETEIKETKNIEQEQNKLKENQQEKVKLAEEKLRNASLIEEKFKEQETLMKENERLEQMRESIVVKKEKLHLAKKAQQIIPLEEQSASRKLEWQTQIQKLQEQEKRLSQIQRDFEHAKAKYVTESNREQEREDLKEEIKQAKKQLEYVKTYQVMTQKVGDLKQKKTDNSSKLNQLQTEIQNNEATVADLEVQLKEESNLTQALYETKDALKTQEEIRKKIAEFKLENQKLIGLRQNYTNAKNTYIEKQEELKKLKEKHDELDRAQRDQFAFILAHQLIPGEACPVCGSTEHPNKAAHDTVQDDFQELEQLKTLIRKKEVEFDSLQQDFVNHKTNGQTQRTVVDKIQGELNGIYPNYSAEMIPSIEASLDNEIKSINRKLDGIANKQQEIKTFQDKKASLQNKNIELKQTFDLITKHAQEINDELVRTVTQLEELEKQLPEELQDPYEFTKALDEKEKYYLRIVKEWELVKTTYEQTNELMQKQATVIEQLQSFEKDTKKKYELQYDKFLSATQESGFDNLELYNLAKLSSELQKKIEVEIDDYESNFKRIRFRLEELNKQLTNIERANLEVIAVEVETNKHELQVIQEKLLELQSKIKHDEDTKRRLQAILENRKDLEADYYIVGTLANLSSGNNTLRLSFERYVLASFLEEILLQANVRLDRMTDHRYQLVRSGEVAKRGAQSGLDLEVMDHHTGITRSVKTLSGGEGFKAALSLALGLADVVQAHAGGVQLDTLFIDEGFGTLDEVSLQQAIDCLKDLQESNRLLGIISHVPSLKNEIHTKLVIEPSHRGSNLAFRFGN